MKIKFELSTAHFAEGMKPSHGPQSWPWWKLFSLGLYRILTAKRTTTYRLWFYTRWGAGHINMFLIKEDTANG